MEKYKNHLQFYCPDWPSVNIGVYFLTIFFSVLCLFFSLLLALLKIWRSVQEQKTILSLVLEEENENGLDEWELENGIRMSFLCVEKGKTQKIKEKNSYITM